jgi:opacity protein-like surface antigen
VKHFLAATCVAFCAASPALADGTFMLGGTLTFGANQQPNFGVSARFLENNQVDESTLGAGVTYYVATQEIGVDVFAGYIFDSMVFGLGYDLVQSSPVMSLGIADTD